MKLTRTAWMEVDLDKLIKNIENIKSIVDKEAFIISVVKSNAYGFGDLKIVETLKELGINYFAVATNSEAIKIKRRFPDINVLVLGYTPPVVMEEAVENNIIMSVYNYENALKINDIAKSKNKVAKLHIVVDSGMNRIGFKPQEESYNDVEKINKLKNVEIEGIFTHFAAADTDKEFTENQFKCFENFVSELEKRNVSIPIKHVNNSQGVLNYREYSLNAVRPGIIQYGSTEGVRSKYENFDVEFIGEIKAQISNLKTIKKGEKVSYGLIYEAQKDTKVATIPIGYADGFIRQLSGKIEVLISGKRCKQIGRMCMDQMMIDVSNVDCKIDDEVVLLGTQGDETITIDEIAETAGEIVTSFACHFSMRLPRVYIKNGKIESIYDINLQ